MKPTAEGPYVGHTVRLPTGFGSGNAEARVQQEDNYSMVKQFFNGRVLRPGRKTEQLQTSRTNVRDPARACGLSVFLRRGVKMQINSTQRTKYRRSRRETGTL